MSRSFAPVPEGRLEQFVDVFGSRVLWLIPGVQNST